jgi:hypothetical protein
MFHIGNGTAILPMRNCTNPVGGMSDTDLTASRSPIGAGREPFATDGAPAHGSMVVDELDGWAGMQSNAISVASALGGPWLPLVGNTLPPCNNPAPWVHPKNGTLYALCDDAIYRADSIVGPWCVHVLRFSSSSFLFFIFSPFFSFWSLVCGFLTRSPHLYLHLHLLSSFFFSFFSLRVRLAPVPPSPSPSPSSSLHLLLALG